MKKKNKVFPFFLLLLRYFSVDSFLIFLYKNGKIYYLYEYITVIKRKRNKTEKFPKLGFTDAHAYSQHHFACSVYFDFSYIWPTIFMLCINPKDALDLMETLIFTHNLHSFGCQSFICTQAISLI